jgi:hypothetical protein
LSFLVIKSLWWNETAEFSLDQFGQLQRRREGPVSEERKVTDRAFTLPIQRKVA